VTFTDTLKIVILWVVPPSSFRG